METYPIPKEWDSNGAQFSHLAVDGSHVDGKVWVKNSDGTFIYRLDLATKEWENLGAPKDPRNDKKIGTYGLHSDAENNVYLLDFSAGNIAKIDAKTKAMTVFLTPTPNSRPRRGRVDPEGRLWFAEYQGEAIGMFDPATGKIQEWKTPTPWSAPYDAVAGRNGEAWTGSMWTDRVVAARHQERPVHRLSAAAADQYPARFPRRYEIAGRALGRQQSRRVDHQGRASGVIGLLHGRHAVYVHRLRNLSAPPGQNSASS